MQILFENNEPQADIKGPIFIKYTKTVYIPKKCDNKCNV